jgi:tetratricopeptide (TPR) repeat protein
VGEVAIWGEQGIGDQILYSTLLPELVGTGKSFLYEVDARLLPAYQRAFAGVRFVPLQDPPRAELQRASRVLMAGSLPGLFRTTRASFSRQPARLLTALPERVAHYRKRLEALGPGLKVGLSWRSTRQDWLAVNKNASLADMAPLLQLPGMRFVDVQYGDTADERRAVEAATGARLLRFDEVDYYNDLEEVLAILEACDLLVTTSNANTHFAGALGKRTWLLYLEDRPPFHYWAHGGGYRSIWYPSVEIVSGVQFREWPALIAAVAQKLTSAGTEAPAARTGPLRADRLAHARALRGEGKVAEAIAACRRVIEEHPGDAQAWSELAHGLRWRDDLNGARSAAARAIEIAPGLASAWFNLGAVQVEQGETAAGIVSYRKALEIEPAFAEAWSNLGAALGAAGDNAGEIEAYLHAISVNPGLAPVWGNLGNALLEAGDVDEAISACRRAVEVDAGCVAGWSNLGRALLAKAEYGQAIESCEKALELAPQLVETHINLGMALRSGGRNAEAAACFRRALAIDPHHARAKELLETMTGRI